MTLAEFARRAISVPFVDRGRDYTGWDCWGLVWLAYRDVYGVSLPSYAESYPDAARKPQSRIGIAALVGAYSAEACREAWREVSAPQAGDIALFRIDGRPLHVALAMSGADFLHADRGAGTAVERFSSPSWRRRLLSVYRHVG